MSSCSSESDCYFCPPHGTEYVHRTPFYATMGQPLVYYAQVGGCKDSNPNCFVKVFRWYTQDHKWQSARVCKEPCKPDVAAFATWLDDKYEQFLAEQAQQVQKELKTTQTSVLVSGNPYCKNCVPCTTNKRFDRFRSQWYKNRRQTHKNEGKLPEKTDQSMEYIMTPKSISRAASDCCHPSPLSVIDTVNVKRKSQSVTNLCPNPETNIDIVTIHEGPPINRPKQSLKSVQIQGQKPISTMVEKPSENLGKNETLITRSCACCVCVNKVDAHTQYEIAIKTFVSTYCETPKKNICPTEFPNSLQGGKYNKEVFCEKSEYLKGTPCSTKQKRRTTCECYFVNKTNSITIDKYETFRTETFQQNIKVVPPAPITKQCNCSRSVYQNVMYVTSTVQTSDHCINFENDVRLCPLFLKIACSGKPLIECICAEK